MPKEYITVGRLGRPFGIKGFSKINSDTDPFDNFLNYSPWHISLHDKLIPLIHCELKGNFLIGQVENCYSPEEAKKYSNCPILILRSQLPTLAETEFYWTDLIGLKVYNLANHYFGEVTEMLETGANDVLVVNHKILIPYVLNKYIIKINLEEKKIIVDWEKDWL